MADDTTIRTKIVLEGEAQYRSAMADINRQLKETKSALSAAAAEYANADAATRTSAAQADALNRSLEQQRERLAMMEAQLKKVENAYGQNSRQAVELRTKINNARAEMAKTQTQLRGLADGLEGTTDAAQQAGDGMDAAADGIAGIGESAQQAQEDVRGLAGEIGDAVGQKLIEFEVGKKALEQLASGVRWALGEAIQGMTEDAQTRALAGDDALSARRTQIKDAIDRTWAGERDGSQTVADVAVVDTVLGNKGITDMERVKAITDMAITQSVVFGQSVQDTMDRATAMVNAFGMPYEDAIDLMTKGMRDMSDGGAQMLSAFETYPQLFRQLGYSAEEMYGAIATASNDANLGKDSAFVKGVETFINTVTSGSKESKKALKALGIEVTDLPRKFQQGGEAAEEATQLILGRLSAIADEAKRNDLGKALFGDKIWTDSAGGIADVILSGYGKTVDAAGATMDAMQNRLDTFANAAAQTGERASQELGDAFKPLLNAGKEALQALNQNADETGGLLSGLGKSMTDASEQVATGAAQAFDSAKESYQGWARELATDIATGRWVENLKEKNAEAAQVAEQTNQTVEAQREALDQKLAEINQAITDADIAGNYAEAAKLTQEREQIISDIASMAAEVKESYTSMGEDAADAVEKQGPKMQSAADSLGQHGVDALLDKQPDMMDAGNLMGGAGVLGTQSGLNAMYGAGVDGAAGAVSGLETGIDDAYSAGYRTGKAYERGFKAAQKIESPSKVMRLAAQYSVQGLLEGYDEGESEAAARGAAIAEAFHSAYSARGTAYSPAGDAQDAGAGISPSMLAEAVRGALDGAGVYLDGQRVGELTAPGVSAGIARRAGATVRGVSARAKGW